MKLHVFTEHDDKYKRRTITYVNPAATDDTLMESVRRLNALCDNNLGEVYKVDGDSETDLTPITAADIAQILSGNYRQATDSTAITADDINAIMEN